jgi:hypothetical protein
MIDEINADITTYDERYSIQSEEPGDSFFDFAPKFLAVEDPPREDLVNDLVPEGVLALKHGPPRTRKSWGVMEIAIAIATGTPAFGLKRFSVSRPRPVLYTSEEDGVALVRMRARALLRGRGISRWPETLAFAVHRGINFDSPKWCAAVLEAISTFGFAAIVFDAARRYSLNVDKGPAEVQRLTGFLRRIVAETGATVLLVHHDVKPPASGKDDRGRSHRASGGDWFAASECPIAFEIAGARTLVFPENYKISADPEPFAFQVESDDPKYPTIARLVGEDATAEQAADLAVQEKILGYMAQHAGSSGSDIAKKCRMNKERVLTILLQLEDARKVDSVKADKKGKATRWFLNKNV